MALFLTRDKVLTLDQNSLLEFVARRIRESSSIDYKEAFHESESSHQEFLKDVTAFANAYGGLLLYGVKEPPEEDGSDENLPDENRIVGIPNGNQIAKNLERVASSSIDPRIIGLLLQPVPLADGNYVIVVYIPASLIQPHVVVNKHRRIFYVRHSESSVAMTTHEVREAVLRSATSMGQARDYAIEEEVEALEYIIKDRPAFLLQAMPLITIERRWDVLNAPFIEIIRNGGVVSRVSTGFFEPASNLRPTPTIKGVKNRDNRENPTWQTDVHQNGFIQYAFFDTIFANPPNERKPELSRIHTALFSSFCVFCEALWKVGQTDVPYLFRLSYLNSATTVFSNRRHPGDIVNIPGNRKSIVWPELVRQIGEPLDEIQRTWSKTLFHAFGLNAPKVPSSGS